MKPKLVSHKPYILKDKGSSLSITIPQAALLFTDLKAGEGVWMYATPRGLLLSPQRLEQEQ
jgi:hypothetical protein